MNYADYSGPTSGYAPYATPKGSYLKPAAGTGDTAGGEGTFSELMVTTYGHGDFHINHFIAFSEVVDESPAEGKKKAFVLTKALYNAFPIVFSKKNAASAFWGTYYFEDHKTVGFELGGTTGGKIFGIPHTDWVAMQPHIDSGSFFATTLKREWLIGLEVYAVSLQGEAVEISQRHVLAGRRSWMVGFDADLHRYYVETATLERDSSPLLEWFDEISSIPRQLVKVVWSLMITNFIEFGKAQQIDWIGPDRLPEEILNEYRDYSRIGDVLFRLHFEPTMEAAVGLPWFEKVLKRHPGLTEGVI